MRAALPQVSAPVLLVHSRDDRYVLPESMPSIHDRLGSLDKRMLWIEGSGHVITEDAQREAVFKAAASFLTTLEPAAPISS
jgi:carboxylesterase